MININFKFIFYISVLSFYFPKETLLGQNQPTSLEIVIHSEGSGLSENDFCAAGKLKNNANLFNSDSQMCSLNPMVSDNLKQILGVKSVFEQKGEVLIFNVHFQWSHALARERIAIAASRLFDIISEKKSLNKAFDNESLQRIFSTETDLAQQFLRTDNYRLSFSAFSHFGNLVLMLHEMNKEKGKVDPAVQTVLNLIPTKPRRGALDNKIGHVIFFGTPILPETETILSDKNLSKTFSQLIFCASNNDGIQTIDHLSSRSIANMFLGPKRFPSVPKINKSFIYHVQVEAWNDTKQFKIGHIPMYIKTCNLGFIPISQFRDTIRDIVTDKAKDFKFILSLKNRETPEVQITAKIDKSMYWNRAERGLLVVGTLFFSAAVTKFFCSKGLMKLKEKSKISSKNGDKTKNKDDSEAKNKKTTFNAKIIDFFKNPTNCIGSFGGLALMCGARATTLRYLG